MQAARRPRIDVSRARAYHFLMLRDGAIATWSDEVTSAAGLREGARQSIVDAFATFPYCLWSPAFAGNYGRSRSTYLCLGDGKVGIVRAEGRNPKAIFFSLAEIDEVETGTELLSSWIAFHAHGQRAAVFFNTVSRPLYARVVEAYRAAREAREAREARATPELHETRETREARNALEIERYFAELKKADFKYDNYARLALENRLPSASFYHPSTGIVRAIFGPRMISSYLMLAARGLFYSFSEARIVRSARAANYSMVIRYIPIDAALSCRQSEIRGEYSTESFARQRAPLLDVQVAAAESRNFSFFCEKAGIRLSGA